MRNRYLLLALLGFATLPALAELEPFTDYEIGTKVYSMTTIKVDPNMSDVYLEGLKQTWVASNEAAKKLGQIADYHIYQSSLSQSGEFNILLVVVYDSLQDLEPSKERYDAFMKAWGDAHQDQDREISQSYPDVRTITGEYQMREITIK